MLEGAKWQKFLQSNENKERLIELIWKYFKNEDLTFQQKFPIAVTVKDMTYELSPEKVISSFNCNH